MSFTFYALICVLNYYALFSYDIMEWNNYKAFYCNVNQSVFQTKVEPDTRVPHVGHEVVPMFRVSVNWRTKYRTLCRRRLSINN